jgi:DNA-binding beta-propeller fold protein YncE
MRFRRLSSILIGFLISSGLLLGSGASWEALVCTGEMVVPIAVPSDIVGTPVSVSTPVAVAITPDAARAIVTNEESDTVTVLDLTQPIIGPGYVVGVGDSPTGIAISPDGNMGLVVNSNGHTVSVLSLNPTVTVTSTVPVGTTPQSVAITPDGSKALVANSGDGTVSVLSLSPSVQVLYTISGFGSPVFIVVMPDGTRALVVDSSANSVHVLDLTQSIIGSGYSVAVGTAPSGAAITSDGTKAVVVNFGSDSVSVLDLTPSTIVPGYSVAVATEPNSIAITPNGARGYVTSRLGPVSVLDLTQSHVQLIDTISFDEESLGIAITPDQAPTSLFTKSIHGLRVSFNGSSSSSPIGNVSEYIWDFGDGSSSVTATSPTVSHTYARSGTYTVTLTVVNDAGTSLEVTFTGQTVSNYGLPRARSTQVVSLRPLRPHHFIGRVHLHKHHKKVFLKTKWHPSTDRSTKKYEITARHRKVKFIKGRKAHHATIRLHPRHFPHHISKMYRLYLHHKYAIRSINVYGTASYSVPVHIKH